MRFYKSSPTAIWVTIPDQNCSSYQILQSYCQKLGEGGNEERIVFTIIFPLLFSKNICLTGSISQPLLAQSLKQVSNLSCSLSYSQTKTYTAFCAWPKEINQFKLCCFVFYLTYFIIAQPSYVLWPAFGWCTHPKAGWNTFLSRFWPFLLIFKLFQWFHHWNLIFYKHFLSFFRLILP